MAIKLIAGLGNPGSQYERTRHNIGFACVDRLAEKGSGVVSCCSSSWCEREGASAAEVQGPEGRIWLVKPQRFMNRSGEPIAALMRYYRIQPAELVVVFDDIDLPLGAVRIRQGGRDGGHNGVKSIIAALGTEDFLRVKLGVGRPGASQPGREVADWVLGRFGSEEVALAEELIAAGAHAVAELVERGVVVAQQRCNRGGAVSEQKSVRDEKSTAAGKEPDKK